MRIRPSAHSGFVLITTLMALGIVLVALAVAAGLYSSHATHATREAMIARQAEDMRAIAQSLDQYMRWAGGAWTVDQVYTIPMATLRDNGLAAAAGAIGGRVDVTPWLQSYAVKAVRRADGTTRGVVYATGAFSEGVLRRSGDAQGHLSGLVDAVAARPSAEGVSAGVVSPGSPSVTGSASAFAMDLSDFLGLVSAPSAVVLTGFPDLDPAGGGGTQVPPGTFHTIGRCGLARGGVHGDGVCPSGYKTITRYPHCGDQNDNPVEFSAKASPAGMIVFGSAFYVDSRYTEQATCNPDNGWCVAGFSKAPQRTHTDIVVTLEGGVLDQYTCQSRTWGWPRVSAAVANAYGSSVLGDDPSSACAYFGSGRAAAMSGDAQCAATNVSYHGGAYDALCCR